MGSSDRGHDIKSTLRINKIEFLIPDKEGIRTLQHDGLEVSISERANTKFTLYTANKEIIILRAGSETPQLVETLNQSVDQGGHIDPSVFFSKLGEASMPEDTSIQRTVDIIFVENRRVLGGVDETSKVTHITRGNPKLNRLQTEENGNFSQYVIAERSNPASINYLRWSVTQKIQGKTRTVIFLEGESSLTAKLTGGNRLSLEGDQTTFPVTGSNRQMPPDFQKPFMYVVTEADITDKPIATPEIASRVHRVLNGTDNGVIVVR